MPEETRTVGRPLIGPAVVFALSCAVFWASTRLINLPPAWFSFEFCQYAEIGKNLATEGTFETQLVEPMALAYIDAHRVSPPGSRWPVLNRYPLPCLVIAGLMTLFGPTDTAAAWSNGLAASGLAALAYVLAWRWYGRAWAVLVAVLILANPAFYGYFVLLGTPDVWFALIFALELLAWCRLTDGSERPVGLAIATGLLAGLSYLARFNVVVFLAPQLAVLLWRRRGREAAWFVATAAVIASPMALYNMHHFGRPLVGIYSAWNLLDDIGAYQREPWLYYRVPRLAAELRSHLGGAFSKFTTNLTREVPLRIWSLWHLDLILLLAVPGVVVGQRAPGRRFLLWAAGLFALQLVLFSALRLELEDRASPHHGRYFFWFAVPAILLGVSVLKRLADRSRWWHALTALVIAGQLSLFLPTWAHWILDNQKSTNLGRDPIRKVLMSIVSREQVIASNQPQLTDWFCQRRSISLPADPDELARLNQLSPTPIDYLFIDLNYNAIDLDPRWGSLVRPRKGEGPGWEPVVLKDYQYVFRPERSRPVDYVLLRRRSLPPSPLERAHWAAEAANDATRP